MLKSISFVFLLVFSLFISGCSGKADPSSTKEDISIATVNQENNKLIVYTTIYPLEYFTKRIGKEHVEVESIMPPGSDAHTYELTSKQMVTIAKADAFIFNGLGMESFAEKIDDALKSENVLIISATEGIETIEHIHEHNESDGHTENIEPSLDEGHTLNNGLNQDKKHVHEDKLHQEEDTNHHDEEDHDHGNPHHDEEVVKDEHSHEDIDPHVWLDPFRSIILAENIKNTLITLKPEQTAEFEKNFSSLKTDLENLDKDFHTLFDSKKNPEMIVAHAAYGYWEENYGLQQIAVTGLSPTNEPSQRQLEDIIQIANEKNLKYVLFEQNITPKVAEVIRSEINATPLRLHNLSTLTEEDIKNGEDYFSLMYKNLETLDKALN
ncbi:metal ABC transporter solute-binding protein, Zn/Mn family [Bacillus sp. Marseille-P3661]|uniref:metal ABC transporter solute-binding protein, Zn/Mn family n=1 Tax=Bacillus sp. Marseille-P3661 TaxID=1936234 RepID=UPI000C82729D|nr:zinc ABC transporter substrate-binding protein [Bacillus sp. Marseille-P3661]